jgi:H+/gluconate symporter-like permease
MYASMAQNFINSGVNLEALHRLTSIAAGALDTLPHSPGLFLTFAVLGLNHKQAYKHVFATSVVVPLVITVALTTYCSLFL